MSNEVYIYNLHMKSSDPNVTIERRRQIKLKVLRLLSDNCKSKLGKFLYNVLIKIETRV
jgi:hypothetical protein